MPSVYTVEGISSTTCIIRKAKAGMATVERFMGNGRMANACINDIGDLMAVSRKSEHVTTGTSWA